jgi:D-alanine-D-alanine ligase
MLEKKSSKKKKVIGLVFDAPYELKNTPKIKFPNDARSEWEDEKTINKINETWKNLGFDVKLFPVENNFFSRWQEEAFSCDLIHSLCEGFGSLSREAWIPSLCELSGIPYIGSSPFAHSFCMNKMYLKSICQLFHIPTAPFYLIQNIDDVLKIPNSFFKKNVFLKPNGEGSGMGVDASFSICSSKESAYSTAKLLLEQYSDGILIEKYLGGKEYTSAVLGSPNKLLPIAQIEVDDGVYGASNKGKDYMGEKVTFPKLNKKNQKVISEGSLNLFAKIPLYDFVRFDWKCDEEGNVYFLEANTLAGLSYYYGVLPVMAKKGGLEYSDIFKSLYESAITRSNGKHLWYGKSRISSKKSNSNHLK